MLTKIQKWGNSQGFRIPKSMLEQMHVTIGDDVEMTISNGTIVICPISRVRNRYDIHKLVSMDIETDGEIDLGEKMGNEAW